MKRWELRRRDKELSVGISEKLNISQIASDILSVRGIGSVEEAAAFLSCADGFKDPYSLKDMDKAVERISRALEDDEKICIYGDYDCDGITSTAMLYSYFESLGADICYYMPDREKEGYGMNKKAVDRIKKFGVSLIITVDNGVSAIEEVEYATGLGIDTVVTDHHKPKEKLPAAVAVVDPHRTDDESGYTEFAGVGVAYKLISALEGDDGTETLERYGDMIAIGTVADITPLVRENRLIVKKGLELIENTGSEGIAAIIRAAGLESKKLSSDNIGYNIAPRINSSSRLGDPKKTVNLLLSEDEETARDIALELESLNSARKEEDKRIMECVEEKIAEFPELLDKRVLVICGEGWHRGVIGITAAKVVEKYGKPCILISVNDGDARGSARSVEGFSIIDAISACSEYLTRYGGHNMAAGLSLEAENVGEFDKAIQKYAAAMYRRMPLDTVNIDRLLLPREVTAENISALSVLEPYGCGNEPPVFAMRKLKIEGIYPIGDNKHIRLRLSRDGGSVYAVYFGVTAEKFPYRVGETVDTVVSCGINSYNGEDRVTVKIQDMRLCGLCQENLFESKGNYEAYKRGEGLSGEDLPDKETFSKIYRYLKSCGGFDHGYDHLCERLGAEGINYCRMRLAIDVMESEKLISVTGKFGEEKIALEEYSGKADIMNSRLYLEMSENVFAIE